MKPKNIIQILSLVITFALCILFVKFELHERAINHQNIAIESKQQTNSISKENKDFENDDKNNLPSEWLGEFISSENDYLKITDSSFLYQSHEHSEDSVMLLITNADYDDKEKTIYLTGLSASDNTEKKVTINVIDDRQLDFNRVTLTKQ